MISYQTSGRYRTNLLTSLSLDPYCDFQRGAGRAACAADTCDPTPSKGAAYNP